jgi:hypothetical protein
MPTDRFKKAHQLEAYLGLVPSEMSSAEKQHRGRITKVGDTRMRNARRYRVPESVVMRMSGHKTRAVFERHNVVAEEDLRDPVQRLEAARLRQKTVKVSRKEPPKTQNPLGKYREGLRFPSCGGWI